MKATINMNEYVKVQFTRWGAKVWREAKNFEQPGDDGMVTVQLWCLFQAFGPLLWNGMNETPFLKNEIVLAEGKL